MHNLRKTIRHGIPEHFPVEDIIQKRLLGQLENISSDGLMLLCENPLQVHDFHIVNIELPPDYFPGIPYLRLTLHVCWVKGRQGTSKSAAGCKIISVANGSQTILEDVIAYHD